MVVSTSVGSCSLDCVTVIDGGHRASNDHAFWLYLIVMMHAEPLQVGAPLALFQFIGTVRRMGSCIGIDPWGACFPWV